MARLIKSFFIVCLVLFTFTACKKEGVAPPSTSASADDILKFFPSDIHGVFFADVHKMLSLETADKLIKENEGYKEYLEFVEKTGIDPQKDVYAAAIGIMPGEDVKKQEGAAIINLKYDKSSLLSLMEEEAEAPPTTQDYNGMTLYSTEKDKDKVLAFLDDSHILVGSQLGAQACIDVIQKRKENISKNEALSDLLEKTNRNTMFWGAILVPQKTLADAVSENPMLSNLESVKAITLNFDYANKNIMVEIKGTSEDAGKNKQVAEMLTGLKAFGSMAAAEKPEIGELVNAIEVTSTDEYVKITANIPEELIAKLKAKPSTEAEESTEEEEN